MTHAKACEILIPAQIGNKKNRLQYIKPKTKTDPKCDPKVTAGLPARHASKRLPEILHLRNQLSITNASLARGISNLPLNRTARKKSKG